MNISDLISKPSPSPVVKTVEIKVNNINTENLESVKKTNDSLEIGFRDGNKPVKTSQIKGVSIKLFDSSVIKSDSLNPSNSVNTVTNGVFNDVKGAEATLEKVKEITNQQDTKLIYNPTYGVFDGIEATVQLLDIPGTKEAARVLNNFSSNSDNKIKLFQPGHKLVKQVAEVALSGEKTIEQKVADEIYNIVNSGEGINTVVHSQGAAIWADALNIVRNRLLEETNNLHDVETKMSSIKVVTIGGYASRYDFPSEVKLLEIKNDIYSHKGLDPISFIANRDTPLALNIGDLNFKARVVKKVISQDNNRSNLEKGFLKHAINVAIFGTVALSKTERTLAAITNAAGALITTPINSIRNKGVLEEHLAVKGYLENPDISKAIKDFFEKN